MRLYSDSPDVAAITHQEDWRVPARIHSTAMALVAPADINGAAIWVSSFTDNDKVGKIHKLTGDNQISQSVRLPKPAAGLRATQASAMIIVGDDLWITDFNYGRLYRYNTKSSGADAELYCEIADTVQTAQLGGLSMGSNHRLWFTDFQEAKLLAVDITHSSNALPVVHQPFSGIDASDFSATDVVYTAAKNKLWVLMESKKNRSLNSLWCIDVSKDPTAPITTDNKWTIPEASKIQLSGKKLYIACSKGIFYRVDDVNSESVTPVIWRNSALPGAEYVNAFTVDGAGYILAVNNDNNGQVYHLDPNGEIYASYSLVPGVNGVAPAGIMWRAESTNPALSEQIFIADEVNARVMVLTLPDKIGPGPKHEAKYKISAKPENNEGMNKDSSMEIEIHAADITNNFDIALRTRLVVSDKDSGVNAMFSHGETAVSVETTIDKHNPAKVTINTTANSAAGHFIIRAFGRGLDSKGAVIFKGTVKSAVRKIVLTPDCVGEALQHEQPFMVGGAPKSLTVSIEPDDPALLVELNITGPGVFANGRKTYSAHHGETLSLFSEDNVGDVRVVAHASDIISTEVTGRVNPWPMKCQAPRGLSIRRIPGQLVGLQYTLTGFKTWPGLNGETPLNNEWSITLDTGTADVLFKDNKNNASQKIEVSTDKTGVLILSEKGYSLAISKQVSEFNIHYDIATLENGKVAIPKAISGHTTFVVEN